MRKTRITKLLALFLLIGIISALFASNVSATNVSVQLYSEDFSAETLPSKIAGGYADTPPTVSNGAMHIDATNKSRPQMADVKPNLTTTTKYLSFSVDYTPISITNSETTSETVRPIMITAGGANTSVSTLIFGNTLGLYAKKPGGSVSKHKLETSTPGVYYTVTPGTTYNFKILLDYENFTFDFYIDDKLVAENWGFQEGSNATSFNQIRLNAENTATVDNIEIREFSDKAAAKAIFNAESLLSDATVGTAVGNVPQSAYDALSSTTASFGNMDADADGYSTALANLQALNADFSNRYILDNSVGNPAKVNDIRIAAPVTAVLPPLGYDFTNDVALSADVFDQYATATSATLTWDVLCDADTAVINSETGVLSIKNTANKGKITVKAADSLNAKVFGVKEIELTDGTWLVETSADSYDDEVRIYGNVVPAQSLSGITITVYGQSDEVLYTGTTSSAADGTFSFLFNLQPTLATRNYNYKVECTDTQPINSTVFFVGSDMRVPVLNAIRTASVDNIIADVFEHVTYKDIIRIDVSESTPFGRLVNKNAVLAKIAGKTFANLPDVRKTFSDAVAIQAIKEATESSIDSVLEENKSVFNIVLGDEYNTYKADVAKLLVKYSTDFEAPQDVKLFFDKAVIISELNQAVKGNIEMLVEKHKSSLISYGLIADFDDKGEKKKEACFTIFNAEYELLDDYIESMNTVLSRVDEPQVDDDSSSNSGSSIKISGSGSGSTPPPVVINPNPPQVPDTQLIFTDVPKDFWAYDAIVSLANKGIINGRGDKIFAKDDAVTREEFIKMILLGFDISIDDSKSDFADVCPKQWYYPYVATAENLGLINGVSESHFGIGNSISRQDAATILKRVMDIIDISATEINEVKDFADGEEISEYAREAVEFMQITGIMNGVDENNFMPKGILNRAMAAKVIDGAMKIKGGNQ